ncbi:MAG: hypothetical protein ABS942_07315 [Solibacillus sp.]|uniref:hypothetical protein n=1 Tax=Solibacillus sp. FSL H8-0523 TaxID=2954511 RepID=UPI003100B7B1
MKKIAYFFMLVVILATTEFVYSLMKYEQFKWSSFLVMLCLFSLAFSLRRRELQGESETSKLPTDH